MATGVYTGLAALLLAAMPLAAQITVDTVAGGKSLAGVPAQAVGFAQIWGVAWDRTGALVFCDRSTNLIRRIRPDGILETIAGSGEAGFSGDGGPALKAALNWPGNPKFDAQGNLYFADYYNYRIRRVDTSGVITSVAGDGIPLQMGMDLEGPAMARSLGPITDLAVDSGANVYFTETGGNQVRRATAGGRIEVFATVASPSQLAVDESDNLYVAEGTYSNVGSIRRIAPDRTSTRFAGYGQPTGTNAADDGQAAVGVYLYQISGLAAAGGNVYLIQNRLPGARDAIGTRIRMIDANGIIHTIAGGQLGQQSPDGPALPSSITPYWLAADGSGNVAFTESAGGVFASVLREVTAQGALKTVGGGSPKPAPDGTAAKDAWFLSPSAIAFNRAGDLYIAETGACLIRKIGADGLLATAAGTGKCGESHPVQPATGPDLAPPAGLAIDSQNRIYVLDNFGNSSIVSPDGTIAPTKLPLALGRGRIAIDAKDRIYLASLIGMVRVSPGGKPQTIVSPPSQPGVPPPGFGPEGLSALGVDPAGNVYFTGSYLGSQTDYVFRVNDDGTFTQVYGSTSNPLHLLNALSLAADATGNVWIATGLVSMVNAAGSVSLGRQEFGYSGDGGPAQLARFNTNALAFAPNGDLYLLDNNRVRKLTGLAPAKAPAIAPGGIVNAVSYSGGAIAPGELVSIFGANFATPALQVAVPENNRISFGLGRTKVLFNGYAGAITAVTPTQINVFVPYWFDPGTVSVVVQVDATVSAPVSMEVAKSAPGVSSVIVNQDGSINSAANPAARGSIITLYGTGVGRVSPQLLWGDLSISTPFSVPDEPLAVSIGGQMAELLYAGAAPFQPIGVFQINARIPATVAPGTAAISVTAGGATSPAAVSLAVR